MVLIRHGQPFFRNTFPFSYLPTLFGAILSAFGPHANGNNSL
jgi:hypothetical protein